MTTTTSDIALDRDDPEGAIAEAVRRYSNWGRWGEHDVLGTLNFLDDEKRLAAASLIRRGTVFSLSQAFDTNGPQKGWRRRTNPVHTMLDTGLDAEHGQGFPHGLGGADDVIFMPLQASTQWDGLGHIFDHGRAWNGRRAGDVVTSEGDLFTGIETVEGRLTGRGVLLDVGRQFGDNGVLPDGFAITVDHLEHDHAVPGLKFRCRTGRHRAGPDRSIDPRPAGRLGQTMQVARRPGFPSPPSDGCTTPKSPRLLPIRGVSKCVPTSSPRRSNHYIRSPSRTWGCSSARCGIWMPSPTTAPTTASTNSGSPPRR